MSKAMKCDVCKKYYDRYNESGKKQNGLILMRRDSADNLRNEKIYDCCPDCMESLIHFLSDKNPDMKEY